MDSHSTRMVASTMKVGNSYLTREGRNLPAWLDPFDQQRNSWADSNEGRAQFESVIRFCFLLSKRWKVDFKWFFVGHS